MTCDSEMETQISAFLLFNGPRKHHSNMIDACAYSIRTRDGEAILQCVMLPIALEVAELTRATLYV
jgi:hypothetical protein